MNIDKIQESVLGTMKVEGLKPSKFGIENNKKFLKKEISSEQAIKNIINHWTNKK